MELTQEQYKSIETLASINYSTEKIALYLGVDHKEFLRDFSLSGSKTRYHYDRGQLITQVEIDKSTLKKAKDGNLTSIQQWKKDSLAQKLENRKKEILYDQERNDYEQLQALIERGEVQNLPTHLVEYYEQIDFIRSLYNKWQSKNYIINAVALKWPKISKYQVAILYNDTLNFFNLDNKVKVEAWAQIYADKLDNMSILALEMNDLETARRCVADAAAMRGVGKEKPMEVPSEFYEIRPVLYTMRLKDIGMQETNRIELAEFIDHLDITEREKVKVRRDAQVEEVPFVLFQEDAPIQDNQG